MMDMCDVKVSLFASSVRPKLWNQFFKSLEKTSVEFEVSFAGNSTLDNTFPYVDNLWFKYKLTENIKPAQCYHIASQSCTGETVSWSCDDAEYSNDILGKAYRYWKSKNNYKLILSLQTKESGYGCKDGKLFPMKEHTFFSLMPETPMMAPICLMSRKFFNELGGLDRRYICGQYENDIVMRAYSQGANVEIFGDENCYVEIDHLTKSYSIGESTDEESFRERPFAKGYGIDRQVLENSWTTFDQIEAFKILEFGKRPFSLRKTSLVQLDKFEPYENIDLLTKSQSNNLKDRWV